MERPACWQTGDTPVPAELGMGRSGDAPVAVEIKNDETMRDVRANRTRRYAA